MFCGYETYEQYLKSPEWEAKRLRAMEEDGHKCCICGSADNLQVHHLNYKEFEGCDISQVRVLCRSCHEKVHASTGYINGRFGIILSTLISSVLADVMAVLWKGNIPPGMTTRLKGILLAEFERTYVWSGHLAPTIYKAYHNNRHPSMQFDDLISTTTDVWNLNKEDKGNETD